MSKYKDLIVGIMRKFVRTGGFETPFTLRLKNSNVLVYLTGVYSKKNLTMDAYNDNFFVNSSIAHITFNETDLIDSDFPYKTDKNKTTLQGCKIDLTDDLGIERSYTVADVKPSETFGLITIYLSHAES